MIKKIYTTVALLLVVIGFAQEPSDSKLSKGDKLYDKLSYIKSIEVYEKVANRGYKSVELFEKLGDAYFFNSQYPEANKWYTELFNLGQTVDPIYYYRYSQTLKSVGDTKTADQYIQLFSKLNTNDNRSKEFVTNKNYLTEIEQNSNRYTIENTAVNSVFSDYGSSIYGDTLVFSSSRVPEKGKVKKDNWTSDYFSSLYSATIAKDGKLSNVRFFPKEIQTEYHESNPVFTKDGKTMYFTRNNYLNNKKKTNLEKAVLLKIYKATLNNGKWENITELPFNDNQYSCAHPTLSKNDQTLYFVSNMPGGYGESDIYKVSIAGDTYSEPINLGSNINTQGKETFPWVSDKDELYFASDGHLGLGGLDVFVTNIKNDTYTNKISNVGKPINSEFDDFCYVRLNDTKLGFFTSNRTGGQGKDDIYLFNEIKPLQQNQEIEGLVVDKDTNKPIPNAIVTIYDKDHNAILTTKTDKNGIFKIVAENPKGNIYYIKAETKDYQTNEITLNTERDNPKKVVVTIAKNENKIEQGTDLAKGLNIKEILFDLDKYDIRKDAEVELQKIIQVMSDHPNLKIAIRSHTDSRQTFNYNMKLSEKRAKATKNYLIENGISANRLTAKGFGEQQLINNCVDGINCSEEKHQENRRSEFIILK